MDSFPRNNSIQDTWHMISLIRHPCSWTLTSHRPIMGLLRLLLTASTNPFSIFRSSSLHLTSIQVIFTDKVINQKDTSLQKVRTHQSRQSTIVKRLIRPQVRRRPRRTLPLKVKVKANMSSQRLRRTFNHKMCTVISKRVKEAKSPQPTIH